MADSKTVFSPQDESLPQPGELTSKPTGTAQVAVNMDEYKSTIPLWKRAWQHSLTQMLLMSIQAFCGPAMGDAIGGKCEANQSSTQ